MRPMPTLVSRLDEQDAVGVARTDDADRDDDRISVGRGELMSPLIARTSDA
jgi:hypothetical protein